MGRIGREAIGRQHFGRHWLNRPDIDDAPVRLGRLTKGIDLEAEARGDIGALNFVVEVEELAVAANAERIGWLPEFGTGPGQPNSGGSNSGSARTRTT